MTSIIGVSSIYPQTPCSELYRRAAASTTTTTATTSSPSLSLAFPERPHFNSVLRAKSGLVRQSSLVASAIATPNSVLSEEAFKGLGGFSKDSLDSDSEYDSETEPASAAGDDDELALSKLGLPQRLVDSLEKRGISSLFPIQVLCSSLWFCFSYLFILKVVFFLFL